MLTALVLTSYMMIGLVVVCILARLGEISSLDIEASPVLILLVVWPIILLVCSLCFINKYLSRFILYIQQGKVK